jgi:glycosyltransferase involved in cell wall biosynthesis
MHQPAYGIFVKHFVEQMAHHGVTVEKVVMEGRGSGVFNKLSKYFWFFRKAMRALRESEYDLVYAHYLGHTLVPLRFVGPRAGRPLVVNGHGSDVFPNSMMGKVINHLVKPVVRKAELVIVPSAYFADVVSRNYCLPKHKVYISPSGGVRFDMFFRRAGLNTGSDFRIGYVSRIDPGKGWKTLLLALAKLSDSGGRGFICTIIGGGSEVEEFMDAVRSLNLDRRIEYLGPLPHSELGVHYNKMDVFVFPTERVAESLGLVGLEALACGVPVIGSSIGALPSYIEDGKNGFLFPSGDSDRLFYLLSEFRDMEQERIDKFKSNAIASVREYDSKIVGRCLREKLEQLVKAEHTCSTPMSSFR